MMYSLVAEVGLMEFFTSAIKNPWVLITSLLVLGVILVNGWTDAPNAIATCVSTRAMKPGAAIIMAAIFNFLGVFFMTMISSEVASTIFHMVNFGTDSKKATIGLCAALVAIIAWAVLAWAFGIPTSESHALIAGLSGAAIAMNNSLAGISGEEWIKVVIGLVLSTVLGIGSGFITTKIIEKLFKHSDRQKVTLGFKGAQIFGGAAMAFMHGAQDGQKFMGVFLLGAFIAKGEMNVENFEVPIWLMVLCSVVMALGTSIGGYKIIKSVGMGMVKLETYQGFAADLAAAICLLIASVTGIPVSTTHTKTTAIMGVGASKRISAVNWKVVGEMVLAWVLTFPGCGLLGFVMVKIFGLF